MLRNAKGPTTSAAGLAFDKRFEGHFDTRDRRDGSRMTICRAKRAALPQRIWLFWSLA